MICGYERERPSFVVVAVGEGVLCSFCPVALSEGVLFFVLVAVCEGVLFCSFSRVRGSPFFGPRWPCVRHPFFLCPVALCGASFFVFLAVCVRVHCFWSEVAVWEGVLFFFCPWWPCGLALFLLSKGALSRAYAKLRQAGGGNSFVRAFAG